MSNTCGRSTNSLRLKTKIKSWKTHKSLLKKLPKGRSKEVWSIPTLILRFTTELLSLKQRFTTLLQNLSRASVNGMNFRMGLTSAIPGTWCGSGQKSRVISQDCWFGSAAITLWVQKTLAAKISLNEILKGRRSSLQNAIQFSTSCRRLLCCRKSMSHFWKLSVSLKKKKGNSTIGLWSPLLSPEAEVFHWWMIFLSLLMVSQWSCRNTSRIRFC